MTPPICLLGLPNPQSAGRAACAPVCRPPTPGEHPACLPCPAASCVLARSAPHLYLAGLGLAVQAEHGGAKHLQAADGGRERATGSTGNVTLQADTTVGAKTLVSSAHCCCRLPAAANSRHLTAAASPTGSTLPRISTHLCEVHRDIECADDAVVAVGQAVLDVVQCGVHKHACRPRGGRQSVLCGRLQRQAAPFLTGRQPRERHGG